MTLVGEADRKMLKAAIKRASGEDQVRHRHVPPEAVAKWAHKLEGLKEDISGVLHDEKEEKQVSRPVVCSYRGGAGLTPLFAAQLRQAEMELRKGQNLIAHEEEIYSRPARTWFQTGKEKQKSQGASSCADRRWREVGPPVDIISRIEQTPIRGRVRCFQERAEGRQRC